MTDKPAKDCTLDELDDVRFSIMVDTHRVGIVFISEMGYDLNSHKKMVNKPSGDGHALYQEGFDAGIDLCKKLLMDKVHYLGHDIIEEVIE